MPSNTSIAFWSPDSIFVSARSSSSRVNSAFCAGISSRFLMGFACTTSSPPCSALMLMIAGAPQFDAHQLAAAGVQRVEQRIDRPVPVAHLGEGMIGALAVKGPLATLLCVLVRGQLPGNTTAHVLPQDAAADLARAGVVAAAVLARFPAHGVVLPFSALHRFYAGHLSGLPVSRRICASMARTRISSSPARTSLPIANATVAIAVADFRLRFPSYTS